LFLVLADIDADAGGQDSDQKLPKNPTGALITFFLTPLCRVPASLPDLARQALLFVPVLRPLPADYPLPDYTTPLPQSQGTTAVQTEQTKTTVPLGAVTGAVVGAAALVALFGGALFLWRRRHRTPREARLAAQAESTKYFTGECLGSLMTLNCITRHIYIERKGFFRENRPRGPRKPIHNLYFCKLFFYIYVL
jgi:hypothetical protein